MRVKVVKVIEYAEGECCEVDRLVNTEMLYKEERVASCFCLHGMFL